MEPFPTATLHSYAGLWQKLWNGHDRHETLSSSGYNLTAFSSSILGSPLLRYGLAHMIHEGS